MASSDAIQQRNAFYALLRERPVSYHPILARVCEGVKSAIMLELIIQRFGVGRDPNGWFFMSMSQIEGMTGLSRHEQSTARAALLGKGFIEERLFGNPAVMHYRPILDAIQRAVAEYDEAAEGGSPNRQTSCEETSQQGEEGSPNRQGGSPNRQTKYPSNTLKDSLEDKDESFALADARAADAPGEPAPQGDTPPAKKPRKKPVVCTEAFEAWWRVYPKHTTKAETWRYYSASGKFTDEDRDMLLARTEDWLTRRVRASKARLFVADPTDPIRFLKGRRWEDRWATDEAPRESAPANTPHEDPVAAALARAIEVEQKRREERNGPTGDAT